MNIAAIQGEANAIVASWLPGTEGEGVADTLFGADAVHRPAARVRGPSWSRRRARRSTSATRPTTRCTRTAGACAPIRAGAHHDGARLARCAGRAGDAKGAAHELTDLLKPDRWNPDGSPRNPDEVFGKLGPASHAVERHCRRVPRRTPTCSSRSRGTRAEHDRRQRRAARCRGLRRSPRTPSTRC